MADRCLTPPFSRGESLCISSASLPRPAEGRVEVPHCLPSAAWEILVREPASALAPLPTKSQPAPQGGGGSLQDPACTRPKRAGLQLLGSRVPLLHPSLDSACQTANSLTEF